MSPRPLSLLGWQPAEPFRERGNPTLCLLGPARPYQPFAGRWPGLPQLQATGKARTQGNWPTTQTHPGSVYKQIWQRAWPPRSSGRNTTTSKCKTRSEEDKETGELFRWSEAGSSGCFTPFSFLWKPWLTVIRSHGCTSQLLHNFVPGGLRGCVLFFNIHCPLWHPSLLLPGAKLPQHSGVQGEGSSAAEDQREAQLYGSRQPGHAMSSGSIGESGKMLVGEAGKQVVSFLEHRRCKKIFLPPSAIHIPVAGTAWWQGSNYLTSIYFCFFRGFPQLCQHLHNLHGALILTPH